MSLTPEGKIKKKVRNILDKAFPLDYPAYYEMVVPGGYGKSGLDFTCCLFGMFVAIETKAPGEWLTARQRLTAMSILKAGGKVFIISDDDGVQSLVRWLLRMGVRRQKTWKNT